jgi:hypothetical protein
MNQNTIWREGAAEVRRLLKEAHATRHRAGREATKRRMAEMEKLREASAHARANRLEEAASKKSIQFMRRKRQAEQREAEIELKKLGAALRREERKSFRRQPPDKLFIQFEARKVSTSAGLRDLYYDWIGRGFSSGAKRDYSKAKKRSTSRTTPWKSGEMGRKIRYIFRESALEEVEGNTLTNMGGDIVEAVACSRAIEELEHLGRGKNGGVYHHVILALPHQLSGKERAELLDELTQPLREMKLPFCAALHKPDKGGDERNFHAHLVLSLRPMDRPGEYQWEFSPSKRTWLNTPAGLHLQRKFVARSFNRALASAGLDVRWTDKSRRRRGEESPGNNKKGPEGTREEREERQAAKNYAQARQLVVEAVALDQVAVKLDQAEGIFEATGAALKQCVEDGISELRQLAAKCDEGLDTLGQSSAILGQLMEEQSLERAPSNMNPPPPLEELVPPVEAEPMRAEEAPHLPVPDTDEREEKKKKLLEIIAHGDASAHAQMALVKGSEPPHDTLERLREAIRSGRLRRVKVDDTHFRAFANEEAILHDLVACLKTEKGKAYFRKAFDFLPRPPSAREGWVSLGLVREEPLASPSQASSGQAVGKGPRTQGQHQPGYDISDLDKWRKDGLGRR